MKPFGAGPKRRRSGAGLPPGPRAVSVLARRSPAKRSPFKRKPLNSGLGASALPLMSAMDMGSSAAGDQPCNIKVAGRVRPENEREMAGASRWFKWELLGSWTMQWSCTIWSGSHVKMCNYIAVGLWITNLSWFTSSFKPLIPPSHFLTGHFVTPRSPSVRLPLLFLFIWGPPIGCHFYYEVNFSTKHLQ